MFFLGLALLGIISYRHLPMELLPSVEAPFLIIQVGSVRDADPYYLEREAIIPLEGAAAGLENVEKIESWAGRNRGTIYVYFPSRTDMTYAYLKLQERVNAVQADLEGDFFVETLKVDTQALSNMFMNLQVRGSGGVDRIRSIIDKSITPELETVDGIAHVEVFGGRSRSVSVVLDEGVTESYGITPSDVRRAIAGQRQQSQYVGNVSDRQLKASVHVVADYTSISALENIVVDEVRGLRLRDVADVYMDVMEEQSLSRVNGKEAVTMQIVRDTQANLIALAGDTREVIDRLNRELAWQDIEIVIEQDMSAYLEENLDLILNLAITGGILAVLILWYFLRNLRLVTMIALALPLSVFTAFNLFYALGISLNTLSLAGMALAIGMLLDNSVVVLENIYRVAQRQKDVAQAVVTGVKQIARSVSAATLTTVAVFLPFVFAEQFFIRVIGYQIGMSIISTLLVSLVVALLLIPMAALFFMRRAGGSSRSLRFSLTSGRFLPFYNLLLKSTLRFPMRTVLSMLALFFISLFISIAISLIVPDEVELEQFNLYLTMPPGATLETTDLAARDLEESLMKIEELQDVVSQVYEQEAVFTLKLKEEYHSVARRDVAGVKDLIQHIIWDFRIGDVSFTAPAGSQRFRGGGSRGGGGPEMDNGLMSMLGLGDNVGTITLSGSDYDAMHRFAEELEDQLWDLNAIRRVAHDATDNRPEVQLYFDRLLLARLGISLNNIASELASFETEVSSGVSFSDGKEQYDITIIKSDPDEEKRIDDLRQLNIKAADGSSYPLERLAAPVMGEGRAGINRVNQERRIELSFQFVTEVNSSTALLDAARLEVEQIVDAMPLPEGVNLTIQHDKNDLNDFYFLFFLAFLLIYMILASTFESLLQPFIIMFTIPLAAIGGLWAIVITGHSLMNVNALIGFLILLGIVVNNGIIFIDYAGQLRRKGQRRERALLEAGQARLRPIVITALTTIAAMLPLALGREEYVTRIASPFAIAVIGGLAFATFFTLLFIPTVYQALEQTLSWFKGLRWPLKTLQIGAVTIAGILIFVYVESLLWQMLNFTLAIMAIPGLTWFAQTSLRRARPDWATDRIRIEIHNVYKLYDLPGRFLREWRRKRGLEEETTATGKGLFWRRHALLWLALAGWAWFVLLYLESAFWTFFLLPVLHALLWKAWNTLPSFKGRRFLDRLIFWAVPLALLLYYMFTFEAWVSGGLLFVFWTLGLAWGRSAPIAVERLDYWQQKSTRLAFLMRGWYRLIGKLPGSGRYRKPFMALKGVTLEIGNGMFGLLGPNGAGKTTLMRIISGVLEASYGAVRINGHDTRQWREELQGLIGYLPQDFGMYENLSALEFLNYQAILKGLYDEEERRERVEYVINAVHLWERRDEKISGFSGGMKQRIGIAQTLLHLPRILVVDEPTAGLDPRERIRFRNLLVELSRDRAVIFSTHVIEDIASSCDKVAVMHRGELRYLGHPEEMTAKAGGHVWQATVSEEQFETIRNTLHVIHHIRVDDGVRVRILQQDKPLEQAIQVSPTLEDAYLWLLKV